MLVLWVIRVLMIVGVVVANLGWAAVAAAPGAASEAGAVVEPAPEEPQTSPKNPTPEKKAPKKKTHAQILDELLAESPAPEVEYGESESCISRHQIKRIQILGSSLLLVHGRHQKVWINQFPHRCVGLRRNMVLALDVRGSQLCSLDRFTGHDRGGPFGGVVGTRSQLGAANCSFSKFQAISQEQADVLKVAAKNGAFR